MLASEETGGEGRGVGLSALGAGDGTGCEIVEAALDVWKRGRGYVVEGKCGAVDRIERGAGGSERLGCGPESNLAEEGVDGSDGEVVWRGVDRREGLSRLHRG